MYFVLLLPLLLGLFISIFVPNILPSEDKENEIEVVILENGYYVDDEEVVNLEGELSKIDNRQNIHVTINASNAASIHDFRKAIDIVRDLKFSDVSLATIESPTTNRQINTQPAASGPS